MTKEAQVTTPEWKRKQPGEVWQIKEGVYATPYGWIEISRRGKSVSFNLFANMRPSAHDRALLNVVIQLYRAGVEDINADHLTLPFFDEGLDLPRGKRRLDFVYHHNGTLHECELLTRREVGLDRTWAQVRDLLRWCQHLELWVPKTDEANTHEVLTMLGLFGKLKVITYQEAP